MSEKFKQFMNRVLSYEGGYSSHPADKGGETNWGITRRTARANGYHGSMREMTRDQAIEIYHSAFWLRYRCEEMPDALAFQFFDAAINHGYGNAARILQRAVGVADDGIIGNITMAAIQKLPENEILFKFNAERIVFYTKLSTFPTFGKGWLRRLAENLIHAANDTVPGRNAQ